MAKKLKVTQVRADAKAKPDALGFYWVFTGDGHFMMRKGIDGWFGSVHPTTGGGFEVQVGTDLVWADPHGFAGSLEDAKDACRQAYIDRTTAAVLKAVQRG